MLFRGVFCALFFFAFARQREVLLVGLILKAYHTKTGNSRSDRVFVVGGDVARGAIAARSLLVF